MWTLLGVLVPDFGSAKGRELWMGEVQGWLDTGLVDGPLPGCDAGRIDDLGNPTFLRVQKYI